MNETTTGQNITLIIARLLLVSVFLGSLMGKIGDPSGTQAYMAAKGMPMVPFFFAGALALLATGGFSILLGVYARIGAALLLVFIVPATLIFHRFWTIEDPMESQMQMIHFMKNLCIMGGLTFVIAWGTGPWSLDRLWMKKQVEG